MIRRDYLITGIDNTLGKTLKEMLIERNQGIIGAHTEPNQTINGINCYDLSNWKKIVGDISRNGLCIDGLVIAHTVNKKSTINNTGSIDPKCLDEVLDANCVSDSQREFNSRYEAPTGLIRELSNRRILKSKAPIIYLCPKIRSIRSWEDLYSSSLTQSFIHTSEKLNKLGYHIVTLMTDYKIIPETTTHIFKHLMEDRKLARGVYLVNSNGELVKGEYRLDIFFGNRGGGPNSRPKNLKLKTIS